MHLRQPTRQLVTQLQRQQKVERKMFPYEKALEMKRQIDELNGGGAGGGGGGGGGDQGRDESPRRR